MFVPPPAQPFLLSARAQLGPLGPSELETELEICGARTGRDGPGPPVFNYHEERSRGAGQHCTYHSHLTNNRTSFKIKNHYKIIVNDLARRSGNITNNPSLLSIKA